MAVSLPPLLPELLETHPFYKLSDFNETFKPYVKNACAAWRRNVKNLDVSVVIHPHLKAGIEAVYAAIEGRGLAVTPAPAPRDFLEGWTRRVITHTQSSSPESAI